MRVERGLGVRFGAWTSGLLEGCEIVAGKIGVVAEPASRPAIRGGRVSDAESGVTVGRSAFAPISSVAITGCSRSAVVVAGGGVASLEACTLTGNAGAAVRVAGGGAVVARGSDLTRNGGGPWQVAGGGVAIRRVDNDGDPSPLPAGGYHVSTTTCPTCGEKFEYTLPGSATCPNAKCRRIPGGASTGVSEDSHHARTSGVRSDGEVRGTNPGGEQDDVDDEEGDDEIDDDDELEDETDDDHDLDEDLDDDEFDDEDLDVGESDGEDEENEDDDEDD